MYAKCTETLRIFCGDGFNEIEQCIRQVPKVQTYSQSNDEYAPQFH